MPPKTTYDDITYAVADHVARITLNRPDALNGMTRQMRGELAHAFNRASGEARVILLTAAGDSFCAGQDLGGGRGAVDVDLEHLVREELTPILAAMAAAEAPIIAAVNGPAAGAGANLALAADVVIAARSATFTQAHAKAGLMPDLGGTFHLPRLVGLPRAMGMALFGEAISAPQAAEWGLIWEVVEDKDLTARASELAARLAKGPTRAFAATRHAMRQSLSQSFDAQMVLEAETQGRLAGTRDFAEGVSAFLNGREPDFEGR